ncbi:MAG: PAS domain-containing protein [Tistlia sp.]|uniref:PAS domain-containing protein n=1 Tax=Tistlia sp. TaxID=3057121 RepID=UPI0034A3D0AF
MTDGRMRVMGGSPSARAAVSPLPTPRGEVRFEASAPEGWLLEALGYWRRQRGGRRWPRRADIDPIDIPALLPGIILLDLVGAPPRFRKRLVGSAIVEKEGGDTTGRWLDECVNPSIREEVLRQHREAAEAPEGNCYRVAFTGADGKLYSYQRLLLPLSGDGQRVDMLFGGARFLPPVAARR